MHDFNKAHYSSQSKPHNHVGAADVGQGSTDWSSFSDFGRVLLGAVNPED